MTAPAPNQNEPSKMRKILNANVDETIKSRLPRGNAVKPPAPTPPTLVAPPVSPMEIEPKRRRLQLFPAFWTIASLMSITVNIVLIAILLIVLNMLTGIQLTANDQFSGLLGGLYHNFVKMDQATISRTIPVDANIPLNIVVPVQATTRITLAETVTIPNAHVRISTGALNIDADAVVTLPANTPLVVNLDFPLNVQNSIPIHLDVPVNIPLNETQLHEPFVGLRQVVEPWYCLVEPNAVLNGMQICSPVTNPGSTEPINP
ncbi:MAG: hypothetical protein ABI621_14205 [Chloroflexota bacterium]